MIAIKLHPRYRAVQRLSKTIFNRLVREEVRHVRPLPNHRPHCGFR
ncbi:hypothetical protein BTB1458_0120 [Mycobacterium tuberculosis]|nr:hypothetical protein BTB1458_0120 [Mycobacterium tuberculosis]BAQ03946.1 hypothetical protein KURONO_0125 [Mycobacterium tuberculosis str. Kurono]